MKTITITPEVTATRASVMRRMGAAAFVFFLVKGIAWLAAPFIFLWFA